MKTIELKGNDVLKFIDEIFDEVSKGECVQITMYDYSAIAYPSQSKESLRLAILKKLKMIKNKEENLQALRKYTSLSRAEIQLISETQNPEDIADTCLEYGISGCLRH